jgi:glycosyltransferase involved in cell wall biosynthesis
MTEVMAAIDVLLHPPLQPEPFGLVLVEAMATAKPVVASRAGGIPEVVEDGETGLLFKTGDWKAAAAAVIALLGDPARAKRIGLAGRARVERLFEISAYVTNVQAVYDGVLRDRQH